MVKKIDIFNIIQEQITNNNVVLYMKGKRSMPMCGFSNLVVEVLNRLEVNDYLDVDVLHYPEIRQGIKDFSKWPTIPQLYINGEFVGGADIIHEMYKSGELRKLLKI
jgi:monothiol glutaredoxin